MDYTRSAVEHMCTMWDTYLFRGTYANNVNVCTPVFMVTLLIIVSSLKISVFFLTWIYSNVGSICRPQ